MCTYVCDQQLYHIEKCTALMYRLEQEAIDEETNHLRKLEQTKQQVVRDKQGRLQAEIDAVAVSEEERKEVCTYIYALDNVCVCLYNLYRVCYTYIVVLSMMFADPTST